MRIELDTTGFTHHLEKFENTLYRGLHTNEIFSFALTPEMIHVKTYEGFTCLAGDCIGVSFKDNMWENPELNTKEVRVFGRLKITLDTLP